MKKQAWRIIILVGIGISLMLASGRTAPTIVGEACSVEVQDDGTEIVLQNGSTCGLEKEAAR